MLKQKHQIQKTPAVIKKCIVGKENKGKMGSFQDLNFSDIFASMDEEYLEDIAIHDPKQLLRMCTFLTLDAQLKLEGITKSGDKIITD
jgi:hypothetical protein|tara:strand:- start:40 stop:303 length:264 start_codon:yes stop_codon:yes gene_type:complete